MKGSPTFKFCKGSNLNWYAVGVLLTVVSGLGTHHVHLQIQSQGLEIPQPFQPAFLPEDLVVCNVLPPPYCK